jgi:hypothetical protein
MTMAQIPASTIRKEDHFRWPSGIRMVPAKEFLRYKFPKQSMMRETDPAAVGAEVRFKGERIKWSQNSQYSSAS